MSPVRRFAAGAVLAAVAILATAAPATAHDQLLESDPGDGEHLDAAPSSVTMTFSGELLVLDESTAGAVVLVVDAEGEDWATGEVEVRGRNVTAALRTDMPDGGYQVRWQVVSEDGHPIAGSSPSPSETPSRWSRHRTRSRPPPPRKTRRPHRIRTQTRRATRSGSCSSAGRERHSPSLLSPSSSSSAAVARPPWRRNPATTRQRTPERHHHEHSHLPPRLGAAIVLSLVALTGCTAPTAETPTSAPPVRSSGSTTPGSSRPMTACPRASAYSSTRARRT